MIATEVTREDLIRALLWTYQQTEYALMSQPDGPSAAQIKSLSEIKAMLLIVQDEIP